MVISFEVIQFTMSGRHWLEFVLAHCNHFRKTTTHHWHCCYSIVYSRFCGDISLTVGYSYSSQCTDAQQRYERVSEVEYSVYCQGHPFHPQITVPPLSERLSWRRPIITRVLCFLTSNWKNKLFAKIESALMLVNFRTTQRLREQTLDVDRKVSSLTLWFARIMNASFS